ncbi:MAG: YbaN family protein [Gemmataceae bacterium]
MNADERIRTSPPPPAPAGGSPSLVGDFKRLVFILLGFHFVAIGIAGVFLPGLPATPFFLLAAYFFSRSSPRLHRWLLAWPLTGTLIRDWQQHRGVRLKVKVVSLVLLPSVLGSSIYFGGLNVYLSGALIAVGLVGATVVVCLPRVKAAKAIAPTSAAVTAIPDD